MKTLEEIKDEYAISKGENCWNDFKSNYHPTEVLNSMDEIAKIYANAKLDYASEKANTYDANEGKCGGMLMPCIFVDPESILSLKEII